MNGLRLWASPVTPLSGTAFGMSSSTDRRRHYSAIPPDTDILITHGPPYGILDRSPEESEHQGCPELLAAVKRTKPKLHVFGHVHGAYGVHVSDDTTFVNAALLGKDGDIANRPLVVDIQPIRSDPGRKSSRSRARRPDVR